MNEEGELGMKIVLGIIFLGLSLFLYCSLKVASECDKIIEKENHFKNND